MSGGASPTGCCSADDRPGTHRVSIIIPLYVYSERFRSDIARVFALDYPDYEILVVTDAPLGVTGPGVTEISTGLPRTGPAEKRDL